MPRRKPRGRPLDGWLVIDKPPGLTSTDVVNRVRRAFDAQKAGHGGTLDPLATGVLPIAFGAATKTVPYVMDGTKLYRFTLRFGEARDTDDADGQVTATAAHRPTDAEIEAALPAFRGDIMQTPPAYSAVKVAGERAYDMAREGRAPVLEPRAARVDRFELVGPPGPGHARCSRSQSGKGVYMRSLARDLARGLRHAGPRRGPAPPAGRALRRGAARFRWTKSPVRTIRARLPRTCCFRSRPRWPTSRRWP